MYHFLLNKSLSKVNVYVGTDGKLHFVNASGADSVLNFSSITRLYSNTIQIVPSVKTYEIGFRPKFFMMGLTGNNSVFWYDETLNKHVYNAHIQKATPLGSWDEWNLCNIMEITDTGFKAQTAYNMTGFIIAFK